MNILVAPGGGGGTLPIGGHGRGHSFDPLMVRPETGQLSKRFHFFNSRPWPAAFIADRLAVAGPGRPWSAVAMAGQAAARKSNASINLHTQGESNFHYKELHAPHCGAGAWATGKAIEPQGARQVLRAGARRTRGVGHGHTGVRSWQHDAPKCSSVDLCGLSIF